MLINASLQNSYFVVFKVVDENGSEIYYETLEQSVCATESRVFPMKKGWSLKIGTVNEGLSVSWGDLIIVEAN